MAFPGQANENLNEFNNNDYNNNNENNNNRSRNNSGNNNAPPDYDLDAILDEIQEGRYANLRAMLEDMRARGFTSVIRNTRPGSETEGLNVSQIAILNNVVPLARILDEYNMFNYIDYFHQIKNLEILDIALTHLMDLQPHPDEELLQILLSWANLAIEKNSLELFEKIRIFGGQPFLQKLRGTLGVYTYAAGMPNSIPILQALLNLGFDSGEVLETADETEAVSSPLSKAIQTAFETKDLSVIEFLLHQPFTNINAPITQFDNKSVLEAAFQNKFTPEINALLQKTLQTRNPRITNVLEAAVESENVVFLKELLDTIPRPTDRTFQMVLGNAIQKNNFMMIGLALEYPKGKEVVQTNLSILLDAIYTADIAIVSKLLEAGAPVQATVQKVIGNTNEAEVTTALAEAAELGRADVVSLLLQTYATNIGTHIPRYGNKMVIEAGLADKFSPVVNKVLKAYDVRDKLPFDTYPEYISVFDIAVLKEDLETVRNFLSQGHRGTLFGFTRIRDKEFLKAVLEETKTLPNYSFFLEAILLWSILHDDAEFFHEVFALGPDHLTSFVKVAPDFILIALQNGNVALVKAMLDKGVDPNTKDEEGSTLLALAALREQTEIVKLLLSKSSINIYELIPKLDNQSVFKVAKEGTTFIEPINKLFESLSERSVMDWYMGPPETTTLGHIYSVFNNPSDVSLCPVCLYPAKREGGCMYMKHKCDPTQWFNKEAYKMYSEGGKMSWCTHCNRNCLVEGQHRHYKKSKLGPPRAKLYAQLVTQSIQFFEENCNTAVHGGGGIQEKLVRMNELLKKAAEIQYSPEYTKKSALDTLSKVYWDAPLAIAEKTPGKSAEKVIYEEGERILKQGHFDTLADVFPLPPKNAPPPKPVTEPVIVFPKPAENAALVPKVVEEDFMNSTNLGDYTKGISFHHRSGEEIKKHTAENGQLLSYNTIASGIRGYLKDTSTTQFGKCFFYPDCQAYLWPEDLQAIPDLIKADCEKGKTPDCLSPEEFEQYKKFFNERFGTAVNAVENAGGAGPAAGGGRFRKMKKGRITIKKSKSTRKMRGGVNSELIPVESCPLPSRKILTRVNARRRRQNRKTRKLRKARK